MTTYAIYDACFSEKAQVGRGMSAAYLSWELGRNGLREFPICAADCILATCQSTNAAPSIRLLRQRYPTATIICGGAGSTSPHSLGQYCDVVCVGDGQAFLATLFREGLDAVKKLPNAWIDGDTHRVEVDQDFPWQMPPIQAEDGAYRLWCGHGCKKKCKFCQTGWAYKYSENPDPGSVVRRAKQLLQAGKKVAYLSNDVMQHSFYQALPPTAHGSYSVAFLQQHGLPPARQIRLGIEGVSEQLRRSVAKPITQNDLVNCTSWLNGNGKSVRWFLIAGLPGEGAEDWLELRDDVQRWKRETPKGVLALSFTAFSPDPATPLAMVPIDDDYWQHFTRFREWFFGGKGWSNKVKLISPQQPVSRIKKAMLSMGLSEDQLREGGHASPNARVNYPYAKTGVS